MQALKTEIPLFSEPFPPSALVETRRIHNLKNPVAHESAHKIERHSPVILPQRGRVDQSFFILYRTR